MNFLIAAISLNASIPFAKDIHTSNVALFHEGFKSIPPYFKAGDNLVLKSDSEMDLHRLPDVGDRFLFHLFVSFEN